VREEQMDIRYGGQSPTAYAALSLWMQYTQASLPQPGMVPGVGAPQGQPPGAVATPPAGAQQQGPGVAMPRQAA